ncbi:MAG: uroporphyrinogen decarboxylase family protein [Bacillota bacterium]
MWGRIYQKRDVVIEALEFRTPPYVPWSGGATRGCEERLKNFLKEEDLDVFFDNHIWLCPPQIPGGGWLDELHYRDPYGVVWAKKIKHEMGTPCDHPIKRPEDLSSYSWPDPRNEGWYVDLGKWRRDLSDRFTVFMCGGVLFERAWTLRGMEDLLADMVERPEFVDELMDAIVEHTLIQVHKAVQMGFDAVFFGDDYGMQTGLIMGTPRWRHFIKPRLKRLFEPIRNAGKYVYLHSCGKVESLFDELAEIGLNVFNPFQPEVMDVFTLLPQYRGRLSFHGGLGVQSTLPMGTADEVRAMTRRLLQTGRNGGYIFGPSHETPEDVPPENLVAMVEELKQQPGYLEDKRQGGF